MPRELVRIDSGITWRRTVIRPRIFGPETELILEVQGRDFSVAIFVIPHRDFLLGACSVRLLTIEESSVEENGGVETGRFRVRIRDGEGLEWESPPSDSVRWGPVGPD